MGEWAYVLLLSNCHGPWRNNGLSDYRLRWVPDRNTELSEPGRTETDAGRHCGRRSVRAQQQVRKTREELAQIRVHLSKRLYELKSLSARNGRGRGMGALPAIERFPFNSGSLRGQMGASLASPGKLLIEEVVPPTTDTINGLVARLRLKKLIRVLTTQEALSEFLAASFVSLSNRRS